jgi:hypothetical protein
MADHDGQSTLRYSHIQNRWYFDMHAVWINGYSLEKHQPVEPGGICHLTKTDSLVLFPPLYTIYLGS